MKKKFASARRLEQKSCTYHLLFNKYYRAEQLRDEHLCDKLYVRFLSISIFLLSCNLFCCYLINQLLYDLVN